MINMVQDIIIGKVMYALDNECFNNVQEYVDYIIKIDNEEA